MTKIILKCIVSFNVTKVIKIVGSFKENFKCRKTYLRRQQLVSFKMF